MLLFFFSIEVVLNLLAKIWDRVSAKKVSIAKKKIKHDALCVVAVPPVHSIQKLPTAESLKYKYAQN